MSRYQPRHLAEATPRTRAALWLLTAVWVVALGGVAAVVLADDGGPASTGTGPRDDVAAAADVPVDIPGVERPRRPENAPGPLQLAASPPRSVEIPAIDVRSDLEALALDGDGSLQAPSTYDVAGWFAAGTEPGQPGPAVIAGHVDSQDGPAVFYELDALAPGDEVLVAREDGQVVRFVVTDVQRHPKEAFPAEAVYGPVPGAELRLITCDGPFDRASGSYRDNLVVFAAAADRPQLG